MTSPRNLLWKPELGSDRPLYRAIVACLERDLAAGRLQVGDRLPTQRDLARELGLGLGTVTRAYKEAEQAGLLSSRVGRGSFVARPARSDSLGLPDEERIELSVDLPVHVEDPDLAEALRRVARRDDVQRLLRYHDHAGSPRHRRAGAAWAQLFDLPAGPDDVIVCNGSQHALYVALSITTRPGDLLLADELTYPGLRSAATHLGLLLHGVPTDEGGLRPEAVASLAKQRKVAALYCVPSLHNPTTRQLSAARREELVALARRHDFMIIEDDVHRLASDSPAPSLARLAPERVLGLASLSKAVAAGLRVAFLVVPPGLRQPAVDLVWSTIWMASPLSVEVAATWIEEGVTDRVVAAKRTEAARRQALCAPLLEGQRFEAQSASNYLWLHLPPPWGSAEFAAAAKERGVSVAPSSPFFVGADFPPPAVRVCLGAAESAAQALRGLTVLRGLLDEGPRAGHPGQPA